LAVQAPLAERPAGVVAGARDDAEPAVLPGHRDLLPAEARLGEFAALEALRRAEVFPLRVFRHGCFQSRKVLSAASTTARSAARGSFCARSSSAVAAAPKKSFVCQCPPAGSAGLRASFGAGYGLT